MRTAPQPPPLRFAVAVAACSAVIGFQAASSAQPRAPTTPRPLTVALMTPRSEQLAANALGSAIRAQLSGSGTRFGMVWVPHLPADFRAQLAEATWLARQRRTDLLLWYRSEPPRQVSILIRAGGQERLVVRRLTASAGAQSDVILSPWVVQPQLLAGLAARLY